MHTPPWPTVCNKNTDRCPVAASKAVRIMDAPERLKHQCTIVYRIRLNSLFRFPTSKIFEHVLNPWILIGAHTITRSSGTTILHYVWQARLSD